MLALSFVTWPLLFGLLATFIPFVLHLLSSVRAQEIYFPTLRFLQRSMEKTARRRRIQQWLLLLLRAGLLALLCLAVAQPISEATGGWLAGKGYVAAVILDNSLSMQAEEPGGSRFAQAKSAANSLLHGEETKPSRAAVFLSNGGRAPASLTGKLGGLRDEIIKSKIVADKAPMLTHVERAIRLLEAEDEPKKSIFLFTDLQRVSFDELVFAKDLARHKDVHLLVVNTAGDEVNNVGVSRLEVEGQRVVSSYLTFTATLVNSSRTDKVVDVGLRVEGRPAAPPIRKTLRAAAPDGPSSTATVQFRHRFAQAREYTGEVYIEQPDQLKADNARRFHVDVGGPVEALVVRGQTDQVGQLGTDPVMMLNIALDPYGDASAPWPIKSKIIDAEQFASTELARKDIVFFCEVTGFTREQAGAVTDFAREGGTVVFFLGPEIEPANYNRRFLPPTADADADAADAPDLLPGRITKAVGELGPEAKAQFVEKIKLTNPYFKGLYEAKGEAGYRSIQAQRYFQLTRTATGESLLTLDNGDDLVLFKFFGKGKIILCGTTASPRWTTLSLNGLFLPMVNRMSLQARQQSVDQVYAAGSKVVIQPAGLSDDTDVFVKITPPSEGGQVGEPVRLKVQRTQAGAGVDYTAWATGTYRWEVLSPNPDDQKDVVHKFVVNPDGDECDLRGYTADLFTRRLANLGLERVYVAGSLDAVNLAATAASEGPNWWAHLAALAIIVLVAEAAVANRSTRKEGDLIPAHLNVRLAA